jgi:hypothetical protein
VQKVVVGFGTSGAVGESQAQKGFPTHIGRDTLQDLCRQSSEAVGPLIGDRARERVA